MIAKTFNHTNKHDIKPFISISIALHIVIFAILTMGYLFTATPSKSYGDESIKAIMIDLSEIAAPEVNSVENSQDIQGIEEAPVIEKQLVQNIQQEVEPEVKPDLIIEKEKIELIHEEPKELVIKDKPMVKQEQQKNKPVVQKASQKMVKQDVAVDKRADTVVAPSVSSNNRFSATPTAISRTPPEYPRRALDMRIEGYVVVHYDVTENGRIENIRIIEAKPNNIFNRAVMNTMKHWKYQSIAAKDLTIKFTFKLNRATSIDDQ